MERKWRYSGFQSATDTQITLATAPVYSATNIFSLIPVAPPTLVTDNIYYVVLKSDTTEVTNNNAFTVTVPANGITTNTAPPTITALTTQAITMDTVAPTITATGPANSAVGVPISSMIGVGFNEAMSPFSLNSSNITLTAGSVVGVAISSFPQGFNLIISNQPTYASSSIFSKVANVVFGNFNIPSSGQFFPQGGTYVSPTAGDIVYFQNSTFPAELGIITNAALTAGTFAVNNFNLFGNQAISKFATATTTGVVTANTALTR